MQSVMKALAWTFVHSLWQGLIVALLVAIIISVTRKTKASLRYNLLGTAFIFFLAAVVITFIIQFQGIRSSSVTAITTGNGAGYSTGDSLTVISSHGFINDLSDWFNSNTSILLLVWVLFFLVNCLKLMTGLAAVNRLRNYRTYPVTDEWKMKLKEFSDALGIRRSVVLLQSELIKVPVALGFLKPVILLPVGLLTNIPHEQIETILLHELGHIRRRDYLVNFLQHFVEAIFFFNPAILWISSLLRQEREACCDDIVVARTGQKQNYLNALVSSQEFSFAHNPYAMGISSRRQYLLNRVKRIVTNENKRLNIFEKAALLAGIILFSAFTYISNEKDANESLVAAPIEQLINAGVVKNPVKIVIRPTISNKKKNDPYKPVTDTVPAKKREVVPATSPEKTVPTKYDWKEATGKKWDTIPPKDWKLQTGRDWKYPTEKEGEKATTDAKTVLQEIVEIKKKIGAKKESIGIKKEQLKEEEGKNNKEEQDLKTQIEKERGELEGQRGELDKKRAILISIKKQNDKAIEKRNEIKKDDKKEEKNEMKYEEKNEKKNELKKQQGKIPEEKNVFDNKVTLIKKIDYAKTLQAKVDISLTDKMNVVIVPKNDLKLEKIELQDKPSRIKKPLFTHNDSVKLFQKKNRVEILRKPASLQSPRVKEGLRTPTAPIEKIAPGKPVKT